MLPFTLSKVRAIGELWAQECQGLSHVFILKTVALATVLRIDCWGQEWKQGDQLGGYCNNLRDDGGLDKVVAVEMIEVSDSGYIQKLEPYGLLTYGIVNERGPMMERKHSRFNNHVFCILI